VRIVQLNPFFFPYAGGTERRILELGRRLGRRHEVIVVTSRLPGTPERETVGGVEVRRLPSRFRLERYWNPPLVSTPGVADELKRLAPDVVDYHYRWAPNYHRAFVRAGRHSRLAFTYNNSYGEGTGLLRWASLANDAWTRRFIRRAGRIVCVSRYIRSDLEARGFPADRLRVVPNGVDVEAVDREAAAGHVPDPVSGRRYMAAVGRLVPIKAFDVAVAALPHLPDDVHLALCGEGPERERLARQAEASGVRERVHLLGWVPEADKLRLLREAVGLLHPARFEAFGLAPLEAMATATPVAASSVGGLVELVEGAGTLVPPDDPAALASAAETWLNPELRTAAGRACRRRAEAYDWDAAAEALGAVYEELVGPRPMANYLTAA
jgi:glycosyltransferase involved in cell wall biosynthesis